jgi:hypothetical protein
MMSGERYRRFKLRRSSLIVSRVFACLLIGGLALYLAALSPAIRVFPTTGHALQGPFLSFWQRHDGANTLGPPRSAPIWFDGRTAQFFARGRLDLGTPGAPADQVVSEPYGSADTVLPPDLFSHGAAPARATLDARTNVAPLEPLTVTLTIPGYSGPAELRLYDRRARSVGAWPLQVRAGKAALMLVARGALGVRQAIVLIDQQIAGARSNLFTLDTQTTLQTGQPRFDALYPLVRDFMRHDVTEYTLDGIPVRGYRSPDSNLLWLRDHTYQARAFRYFEPDMISLIDAFRRAQRPDGSFPDYLARPELGIPAGRMQVEADVEYLFVQAVYEAWQATGDDSWLRTNRDAMRRALAYTMSDPLRWDAAHQLVKRPFTIDTWDFEYGPTTIDPTSGKPAPRHWIDDKTIWGIFHGDNTGLAFALELLARIETRLGDSAAAADDRSAAAGIIARLNRLSWNGSFFTHQIHLSSFAARGVDETRQLSLSNAYALNRGVLQPAQKRAIIDEYARRFAARGAIFAEWYSIDPAFPAGDFGLAGRTGERPGEYVNGGIMPLVGGELARGAFDSGAERYAFDILARYDQLVRTTGESYLWYDPNGKPGISGPETLATDGWGASAMLGALIEGAAGIEDQGARYGDVQVSPRWSAADGVAEARVVARYAASDGYVAYHWQRAAAGLTLDFTGSSAHMRVRLLLPAGHSAISGLLLDGQRHAYAIEDVYGSRYVVLDVAAGSGRVEVSW